MLFITASLMAPGAVQGMMSTLTPLAWRLMMVLRTLPETLALYTRRLLTPRKLWRIRFSLRLGLRSPAFRVSGRRQRPRADLSPSCGGWI